MRGRIFVGIILVILGIGLLMDRTGVIPFSQLISTYWPVILIIIGINELFSSEHSFAPGTALVLIGTFFLLKRLDVLPIDIGKYFWPVLLMLVGLLIIFGRPKLKGMPVSDNDSLDHFVIFSGLQNKSMSKNFKGGSATAILGGMDLDIRDAELSEGGASLDLTAILGGINIKVPAHWKVVVTGTPLLGGWENKTKTPPEVSEDQPTLNIRCFALLGGMDIGN